MKYSNDYLAEIYSNTLAHAATISKISSASLCTMGEFTKIPNGGSHNIEVVSSDTVSAIIALREHGTVCALNMASYRRPGGGVINGAKAQEECLYRCSNLGTLDTNMYYPLSDEAAVYTKNAVFFKDVNYDYMPEVICDVVTIAAYNFNEKGLSRLEFTDYEAQTKRKIRFMLKLANENQIDSVVLGAWGCGVFDNDPFEMATMFKEVLIGENYASLFKLVRFAVINDHNSVGDNYDVFNKVLTF